LYDSVIYSINLSKSNKYHS